MGGAGALCRARRPLATPGIEGNGERPAAGTHAPPYARGGKGGVPGSLVTTVVLNQTRVVRQPAGAAGARCRRCRPRGIRSGAPVDLAAHPPVATRQRLTHRVTHHARDVNRALSHSHSEGEAQLPVLVPLDAGGERGEGLLGRCPTWAVGSGLAVWRREKWPAERAGGQEAGKQQQQNRGVGGLWRRPAAGRVLAGCSHPQGERWRPDGDVASSCHGYGGTG